MISFSTARTSSKVKRNRDAFAVNTRVRMMTYLIPKMLSYPV